MPNKNTIRLSLMFSLFLHAAFLAITYFLPMHKGGGETQLPEKVFSVKILRPPEATKVKQAVHIDANTEPLKFESPEGEEVLTSVTQQQRTEIKKASYKPQPETITQPLAMTKPKNKDYLKESEKGEPVIKAKTQRETRKDLVAFADTPGEESVARPESVIKQTQISEDFQQKMPGFTPEHKSGIYDSTGRKPGEQKGYRMNPVVDRKTNYKDINDMLIAELLTYQDPADGQRYFKISLRVSEGTVDMPALPKEVIFLIDSSNSIQDDRLEEFKRGVLYCLKHLNPDDTFNVVTFKEHVSQFSELAVKPTDHNVVKAYRFVEDIKTGTKTDAYTALKKTVTMDFTQHPSYMLFLSDGRPTEGVVDPRKVINEISDVNNAVRSIFSFSGGVWLNRYLLDFISFKNRGWAEYSSHGQNIGRSLSELYDKIKDPLLLNLRYHLSGLPQEDIFPKLLPDFFRNAEFTLYGVYGEEDKFVLQLLGDYKGEVREFIVDGSLKEAPQGGPDIMQNWAFNKLYQMISQIDNSNSNQGLLNDINAHINKFKLKTPYLNEIIKQ